MTAKMKRRDIITLLGGGMAARRAGATGDGRIFQTERP
jgi:hypothetical protein